MGHRSRVRLACEVLHLNTERAMRGGEVQTLGLMRGLEARGVRSALLARPRGRLLQLAAEGDFLAAPWSPRGEWDLWAAFGLRRWIGWTGARLLHAHTAHALSLAIWATRGLHARPKLVASRRVSFPLRSRFSRWKYARADAVVAVSEEVRETLIVQGLSPAKIRTIHSGVDLGRFEALPSPLEARRRFGIPQGEPVVGAVGALVRHKGQRVLIEALARLGDRGIKPHLVLAGEGERRAELAAQAGVAGVQVHFLGHVAEPAPLYAAFDVLALPSLSGEGSPGVIKEAAAAGVPVVATDVSGTSEILRNDAEALLVPPGESVPLAEALARLLSDHPLAGRLASAAKERVRAFSMDRMAQAHLDLYGELVGGPLGKPDQDFRVQEM